MTITVLLFGIAKDIAGGNKLNLEVEKGMTVDGLKNHLCELYPQFDRLKSIAIAVNNTYALDDDTLGEGDEIAVIPPVSGG
jgi:molybdopterin converting factor subunit 1